MLQPVGYKRKVIGRGACKHPHGRACSSCEFVTNGIAYYFCCGWTSDFGVDLSTHCSKCVAHISKADDLLQELIKEKEGRKKE